MGLWVSVLSIWCGVSSVVGRLSVVVPLVMVVCSALKCWLLDLLSGVGTGISVRLWLLSGVVSRLQSVLTLCPGKVWVDDSCAVSLFGSCGLCLIRLIVVGPLRIYACGWLIVCVAVLC